MMTTPNTNADQEDEDEKNEEMENGDEDNDDYVDVNDVQCKIFVFRPLSLPSSASSCGSTVVLMLMEMAV